MAGPPTIEDLLARPLTPPDPAVRDALEAGPMADARDALARDDLDRLLDPTPMRVENGWCWLPDGVAYVAVRTAMPGTTGEMWDWWFDWHPRSPVRYRVWYPGSHLDTSFRAPRRAGAKPHWGATHWPVEDLGLGRQRIRIEFLAPSEYGFSADALDDARVATIVGGHVGQPRLHLRVGLVCHVFLRDDEGVVLRSRFWIGGRLRPDLPGAAGDAVAAAISRPLVRRMALPRRLPHRLATHCAAEYANLATLLPELYERYA